ncbi:MAG: hypothetical protein M3Q29_23655 [Chloroflexota bacterium]|nr:hypothetical protein [Chloroflexota bacterium]
MQTRSLPLRAQIPWLTVVPRHADAACVGLVVLLTAFAQWPMVAGGTVIGIDASTFFLPMYSFLGDRLRAGDIPMWNPYQFAGAPFAADPQSGWMYFPAMFFFTLLSIGAATNSYLVFHALLGGLGVYALGRALGLRAVSALLAAAVYELNAYTHHFNVRCYVCGAVMAWLPIALLGAEMAIRSRDRLHRCLWWGCAGFALSQIYAGWLGQGAYYALLTLGGYVAYRTLLSPPDMKGAFRDRAGALALHGGALLVFGLGLAAAGLLPRLEYNALSTLAGGYTDSSTVASTSRWSPIDGTRLLHDKALHYLGGATVVLAVLAPFLARKKYCTPFFAGLAIFALVLTSAGGTPVHDALYLLLPGFERLHPHYPERILVVFYLAPAILSGAALNCLWERRGMAFTLLVLSLPLALLWVLPGVAPATIVAALLGTGLWIWGWLHKERRWLAAVLLLLVLVSDLLTAQRDLTGRVLSQSHYLALRKVNLSAYYDRTPAADFLLSSQQQGSFRYFGYDPQNPDKQKSPPLEWMLPRATQILGNNRATSLHLEDLRDTTPYRWPATGNTWTPSTARASHTAGCTCSHRASGHQCWTC